MNLAALSRCGLRTFCPLLSFSALGGRDKACEFSYSPPRLSRIRCAHERGSRSPLFRRLGADGLKEGVLIWQIGEKASGRRTYRAPQPPPFGTQVRWAPRSPPVEELPSPRQA